MPFNINRSLTLLFLWLLWVVFCVYVDLSTINKFLKLPEFFIIYFIFFIIYFIVNDIFFPYSENYNKCTKEQKRSALINFLCLVFLPIFGVLA